MDPAAHRSCRAIAAWVQRVVRAALENAVSVAGMMLSTDALIAELPEPKQNGAAAVPALAY